MREVPDIHPLYTIYSKMSDELKAGTTLRQLQEYSRPARCKQVSFPEPKRVIGKFKLYDTFEVIEWLTLWKRVTVNLKYSDNLGRDNK
jgi:hypothetical protein